MSYGRTPDQVIGFYQEAMRRISAVPGVERVAVGTQVPWREAGNFGPGFQLSYEGHVRASADDDPRAQFRTVSPGFFAALGVPLLAGRDFNEGDRRDSERVVIISQSLAQQLFPNKDAVNRYILWTDPVMQFIDMSTDRRRIGGVVGDIDDENVVPGPAMNVYHPMGQAFGGGRLFVHTKTDPYPLVAPITRIIRDCRRSSQSNRRRRSTMGRGAGARSPERAGLRRLRLRGAADRGRRRGRRAFSVARGRAVRHQAGDRVGAAPPPARVLGERVGASAGIVTGIVSGFVLPGSSAATSQTCAFQNPADLGALFSWPPPSWPH
jgi:hypothetical protein